MMKVCSKCDQPKPLSEFSKSRSNKDGYQYQCKECKSHIDHAYHASKTARNDSAERALLEVQWYRIKCPDVREALVQSLGPDPSFDKPPEPRGGMSTEDILAALANHIPKAKDESR